MYGKQEDLVLPVVLAYYSITEANGYSAMSSRCSDICTRLLDTLAHNMCVMCWCNSDIDHGATRDY